MQKHIQVNIRGRGEIVPSTDQVVFMLLFINNIIKKLLTDLDQIFTRDGKCLDFGGDPGYFLWIFLQDKCNITSLL